MILKKCILLTGCIEWWWNTGFPVNVEILESPQKMISDDDPRDIDITLCQANKASQSVVMYPIRGPNFYHFPTPSENKISESIPIDADW